MQQVRLIQGLVNLFSLLVLSSCASSSKFDVNHPRGHSHSANKFEVNQLADPSAYETPNGRLIVIGTNRPKENINVPMFVANNLKALETEEAIDAMPKLPRWAAQGHTWAPEISRVDNKYILYFTAKDKNRDIQCVGVANAEKPEGPYSSKSDSPLICPPDVKGVIDPSVFNNGDGSNYLLYKVNAWHGNPNTAIWMSRLSPNGQQLVGEAKLLLRADSPWEKSNIEAPNLIFNAGTYYLFYSGANFKKQGYAVGYAKSKNLLGPYIKSDDNPVIKTERGLYSPGSQGIVRDKCGNLLIFFHAYNKKNLTPPRNTYVKKLVFENDKPLFLDVDPNATCH